MVAVLAERRRRLPDERPCLVHAFSVDGFDATLRVGLHADGSPGEVFLDSADAGSTISGLLDGIGVLISLCLQHDVPLHTITAHFAHTRFEPAGFTSSPEIPRCTSLLDYVGRYLAAKYPPPKDTTS